MLLLLLLLLNTWEQIVTIDVSLTLFVNNQSLKILIWKTFDPEKLIPIMQRQYLTFYNLKQ